MRAWTFASLAVLTACRAGLPPEPPGADAADPAASSTPYRLPPNPYETSAFAGEPAPTADEHAGHGGMNHGGMNHGGMNHGSSPAAAPTGPDSMSHQPSSADSAPAPTPPAKPDHSSHGATRTNAADSQAMPPSMPMPEAPR